MSKTLEDRGGIGEVVSVTPTYDAANVPASTNVAVTFSRDMKASSFVPDRTFALIDATNGKHAVGSVSYDAASRMATFDPQSPLSPGHTYEATLVGEDDYAHARGDGIGKTQQTVQDAEGYSLSFSTYWRFTVDIAEPGGLASVTPAPAATGVPASTNITATFAGQTNAAALSGATFTLSAVEGCYGTSCDASGAGTKVKKTPVTAQVSYDEATKTATLKPVKSLAPNATYEARVSGTSIGLSGGDRTWLFTTGSGGEEVTSVTPADGATGVAASSNVSATFYREMDANSMNGRTFELIDLIDGKEVIGRIAYDAASKTATFDPNTPLLPGHIYEATLVGGGKASKLPGVRDAEGNPLLVEKTWRFTVEVADP